MGKVSDDDLKALLGSLEQVGQDPELKITKELQEKIKLIPELLRAERIVIADDGSVAIGGDATGNTFNLRTINQFHLHNNEKPLLEEIVAIHNFDLSDLLDDCLDHLLFTPNGVVGFGLPCNIPKLIPNICERLRIRLDCDCAEVKDHIALNRSFAASIDDIVRGFLLTHKVAKIPNTIFSVQTFENESALAFWKHIKANERHLPVETRLILILVVEESFSYPPDLYELPPPTFRPAHVQEFFMKAVSTRKKEWSPTIVSKVADRWFHSLIRYCTHEKTLHHMTVYQYLKITIDEFKGNTDPNKFMNFLKELEELAQGV